MLAGAPILLIAIIILCVKCSQYIRDEKLRKSFRLSLGIIALSTVLCVVFGTLGNLYITQYQDLNSACPSQYPYAWATFASGAMGIAAFTTLTVKLFKQKLMSAALIMVVATILFALLAFLALVVSIFCLTF